jgi:hypothetical protein
MIDFDSLVMGPALAIFGRPIIVNPLKSQPSAPPFDATGIYSERPLDIDLEDDGTLSTKALSLGVQLSQFAVAPIQGDKVTIPAHMSLPAVGLCIIEAVDDDGQGGSMWGLKKLTNP